MNAIDKYWEQLVFALVVLVISFVVSRILRYAIGRFIRGAASKLNVDPTRYNFFKNAMDFIILLTAVIIIFRSIPAFRTTGTTLLTGAGVLAAIVGFASQSAFSNIISGLFLVISKPFSVGDRVKIGQLYSGDVEDITLRHTVIKDFENKRVVIPNSVISNEIIINSTLTDKKVCLFIEIPVAYSTNLDIALSVMQEEATRHPLCIDNRSTEELTSGDHPVIAKVLSFGDFGILLRAYAWAANPNHGFDLKCDLNKSIKERFEKEGIEFGFPVRVLINK